MKCSLLNRGKLVFFSLALLCTHNASAQTYELLTPGELVMRNAVDSFGNGMSAAADMYAQAEVLRRRLAVARRDFQRCRGDCRTEANTFANLLYEKDEFYLLMDTMERMSIKLGTYFRTFQGGEVDGGIPRECKQLFSTWVGRYWQEVANGSGLINRGAYVAAMPAYLPYAECRDDLENALAGR